MVLGRKSTHRVLCTHGCCLPILCTFTQCRPVGFGGWVVGAGWVSVLSAHGRTNPTLRAVLAASGPQHLFPLTLYQHLRTLLGLLLVPLATMGISQAPCGISWQLGTLHLLTPS